MDLSASQKHQFRLDRHPAAHLHVQQRFKKRKRRPACIQLTQQTRGALFIGVQIVSLFARLRPQLTTPPRSECGSSPVDLLRASF